MIQGAEKKQPELTAPKAESNGADPTPAPEDPKVEGPKTVEFRGVTFRIPQTLPLSVAFDLAGVGGAFADLRFLASVLGAEQLPILRDKLDADQIPLDPDGTKILGDLIEQVLALYGFETGESQASVKS